MKSAPLPDRDALQRAYESLQWPDGPVDFELLVKWAHWSRLDARLAELLVRYIEKSFRELNPFSLWEENRRSPLPQALAVLVEFAKISIPAPNAEAFRVWSRIVTKDLPSASPQMFFLREGTPRPERDFAQIETSLLPYRRWGFFGNEAIAEGKYAKCRATLMGKPERLRVLAKLLENASIRVDDYIVACGGRVHRRTAERDLAQFAGLERKGFTRGRIYRKARR